MIRVLEISVRLGMGTEASVPHHLEKLFKQVIRIVGAGRGFGMVLNAEDRQRAVLHSLNGVVVEIHVSDADIVRVQAFGIDGETVVLRRNLNLVALDIQDRMIAAMMAELQFVGSAAKGQPKNLMSKANSENRLLPE